MVGAYRGDKFKVMGAAALAIALDLRTADCDMKRADRRRVVRNIMTDVKPEFS